VHQHWAFPIPDALSDVAAAPLLCAGITVWSPFVHHKLGSNHRVGIIGVGGLGHLAIQFGAKLGCHVTGISTSADKKDEVLSFGAKSFININDAKDVTAATGTFDFLLATISAEGIDWMKYINLRTFATFRVFCLLIVIYEVYYSYV
jgi:D-arabinose 1-dehydrogenase-like Zn-dependent alcohol dehydrogenase